MSKIYFVQRFDYTLKLLKYQWNMISKENLKKITLKLVTIKPSKQN